ncbi:hypothetical protein GCM10009753_03840 [Streptantibioticus ferralitis]
MAKYLLLKHYRGAPASVNDVPMDQWTPEEISAHVQYMHAIAARLEGTGELSAGSADPRSHRIDWPALGADLGGLRAAGGGVLPHEPDHMAAGRAVRYLSGGGWLDRQPARSAADLGPGPP